MKTKTVRQSVTFKTSPHVIYEMLMDSRKHAKFTGEKPGLVQRLGESSLRTLGILTGSIWTLCRIRKSFNRGEAATGQRDIIPK